MAVNTGLTSLRPEDPERFLDNSSRLLAEPTYLAGCTDTSGFKQIILFLPKKNLLKNNSPLLQTAK